MSNTVRLSSAGISEVSEARLWKTLDGISDRLGSIETNLSHLVRLEERVKGHGDIITRYGVRLDNHENRIRDVELGQASFHEEGIDKSIRTISKEVQAISTRVSALEATKNIFSGQRDIVKEILKVAVTVLVGVIIFRLTRGG